MLNKIKDFLSSGGHLDPEADPTADHNEHENRIAAAALLIEAAHMDGEHDTVEADAISRAVKQRFDLSDDEAASLIEAAGERQSDAIELHTFTHQVKKNFSYDERVHLIEMLWEVVLADGELDQFEDSLLRRIAGLIHVTDRDRGDTRKRVVERLGLDTA